MSQSEHIAMLRIADRMKQLEENVDALRSINVDLENRLRRLELTVTPETRGKAKVA